MLSENKAFFIRRLENTNHVQYRTVNMKFIKHSRNKLTTYFVTKKLVREKYAVVSKAAMHVGRAHMTTL